MKRSKNRTSLLLGVLGGALATLLWLTWSVGGRGTVEGMVPAEEVTQEVSSESTESVTPRFVDPSPEMPAVHSEPLTLSAEGEGGRVAVDADEFFEWRARILDRTTRAPIVGADVFVQSEGRPDRRLETDEKGVVLARLSGQAAFLVRHPPYAQHKGPIFSDGEERLIELEPGGTVMGVVRPPEALGGGVEVGLWPTSKSAIRGAPLFQATVRPGGEFTLAGLPPAEYVLAAYGPEVPLRIEPGVVVKPGSETIVNLDLNRGVTLRGRVVFDDDGSGVAEARVWVHPEIQGVSTSVEKRAGREIVVDGEGRFEAPGLSAGVLELVITTAWSDRVTEEVHVVRADEALEREFRVSRPGGVRGTVEDSTGAAVPNALVAVVLSRDAELTTFAQILEAEGGAEGPIQVTRSDATGAFAFARVPGDRKVYVVAHPAVSPQRTAEQLTSASKKLKVTPGAEVPDVRLTLAPGRSLGGRVVDEDGLAVAGATLQAETKVAGEWQPGDRTLSGADGGFLLEGLVPKIGRITCTLDGYRKERKELKDRSFGAPLLIELESNLIVRGVVKDESGSGVADARVEFRRGKKERTATTDAFGFFEVTRLRPGSWVVKAKKAGWTDPEGDRVVLAPRAAALELSLLSKPLTPTVTVTGFVVDASTGRLVPDLRFEDPRGGSAVWDGPQFTLSGMKRGEHRLELEAKGYATLRFEKRDYQPGVSYDVGRHEIWPAADLRITLRDEEGEPFKADDVLLEPLARVEGGVGSHRKPREVKRAKKKGRYEREDVERAWWTLVVRDDDKELLREPVNLASKRETLEFVVTDE